MKCPECHEELVEGEIIKQEDGTELEELKCPRCKSRFADIKIPYDAMFGNYFAINNKKLEGQ